MCDEKVLWDKDLKNVKRGVGRVAGLFAVACEVTAPPGMCI